ncbi:MAG: hypothetical protein IJ561_05710, partial [Ruminococcus sp.]|nr:hypothetical protein [Ruminococcus sp.]
KWKSAVRRGFLSRTALKDVDGVRPTVNRGEYKVGNATLKQNALTADVIDSEYPVPIYAYCDGTVLYWFSDDPNPVVEGSMEYAFYWQYWKLTDISGLADWDTSLMTNAHEMFGHMNHNDPLTLTDYDFSKWDLSNCTVNDLRDMFKLTNLQNQTITFADGQYSIDGNGRPNKIGS